MRSAICGGLSTPSSARSCVLRSPLGERFSQSQRETPCGTNGSTGGGCTSAYSRCAPSPKIAVATSSLSSQSRSGAAATPAAIRSCVWTRTAQLCTRHPPDSLSAPATFATSAKCDNAQGFVGTARWATATPAQASMRRMPAERGQEDTTRPGRPQVDGRPSSKRLPGDESFGPGGRTSHALDGRRTTSASTCS